MLAAVVPLLVMVGMFLFSAGSGSPLLAQAEPLGGSTKSVGADQAPAGGTIDYTVVLSNSSGSMVTATMDDQLDYRLTYVSGSAATVPELTGSFTLSPDRLIWEVDVPAYSAVTLTFQAELTSTITSDTMISNTAVISDGTSTLERTAVFTVAQAPTVQIRTPETMERITQSEGEIVTVSGYAWDATNAPGFPADPVLDPINNSDGNGTYYVEWDAVSGALDYTLQEATNIHFDENVVDYYDATSPKLVSGKSVGTYYYRLMAHNTEGDSRWSNIVSATVDSSLLMGFPEVALAPASVSSALADPIVEVSIEGGAWQEASVTQTTDGYWEWSYDWTLPQADAELYSIRARAKDVGGNYGEVDTITVMVDNDIFLTYFPLVFRWWPPVPYPPTLSDINNGDGDGDYTVSWTYGTYVGVPAPTKFQLEEDTDPNFGSPTMVDDNISGTSRSYNVTGKPNDTYYYRVRGVNSHGNGPWSNVKSVVVSIGYYDNFSNANSGWPNDQKYSHDGTDYLFADYYNGTYRVKVLRNDNGKNNKKMAIIKAPYTRTFTNYNVEVEHFFTEAGDAAVEPVGGKASLIFAANDSFSTIYAVEWNYDGHCAVNKYTDVSVPVSAYEDSNLDHHPLKGWGECGAYGVRGGYDKRNHFLVEVRNTTARIYAYDKDGGRHLVYQFTDGGLSGKRRTGLVTGSWEWTPVESRFDNYRVEPK